MEMFTPPQTMEYTHVSLPDTKQQKCVSLTGRGTKSFSQLLFHCCYYLCCYKLVTTGKRKDGLVRLENTVILANREHWRVFLASFWTTKKSILNPRVEKTCLHSKPAVCEEWEFGKITWAQMGANTPKHLLAQREFSIPSAELTRWTGCSPHFEFSVSELRE